MYLSGEVGFFVTMAMTPRPISVSLPAGAPSTRPAAGTRAPTATTDGSPVEETNVQTNVSFDTAMMFHHDERTGEREEESSKGQNLVEYSSDNNSFVSILNESGVASGGRTPSGSVRRGFSGYLSHAIRVYETNSAVIHGSGPDPRGSTLSLTL